MKTGLRNTVFAYVEVKHNVCNANLARKPKSYLRGENKRIYNATPTSLTLQVRLIHPYEKQRGNRGYVD